LRYDQVEVVAAKKAATKKKKGKRTPKVRTNLQLQLAELTTNRMLPSQPMEKKDK